MNCGQLCRLVFLIIIIVAIGLFLKDVHTATQERIAVLKKEIVVSTEQANAMRAELEEMKIANEGVTVELENSKKAHAELLASRRALDASEELQRKEKDAIEQKSIELGLKLKESEREKGSLQNLYRELEAERDQIKQKSQDADANLEKCKHGISEKDELLAAHAKEKENLNTNINTVQKEVNDLKEVLKSTNSASAHKDTEIKSLHDNLSKCEMALKARAAPPNQNAVPVAKPGPVAGQQPVASGANNPRNVPTAHPVAEEEAIHPAAVDADHPATKHEIEQGSKAENLNKPPPASGAAAADAVEAPAAGAGVEQPPAEVEGEGRAAPAAEGAGDGEAAAVGAADPK